LPTVATNAVEQASGIAGALRVLNARASPPRTAVTGKLYFSKRLGPGDAGMTTTGLVLIIPGWMRRAWTRELLRHLRFIFIASLGLLLLPAAAQAAKPVCGDGKCGGGETAATCPADCAAPPPAVCGDGICTTEAGESCSTCPGDCGPCPPATCNYDSVCNLGEDCISCPADCPGVTGGKPSQRYCCGLNGYCDSTRCGSGCGLPPSPVCGNGVLETGEGCDDGNMTNGDGCSALCQIEQPSVLVPVNQFNAGDSIGEGEAADGTIGEAHHETVWSTGYQSGDVVSSLNERLEAQDAVAYYENNATRDPTFNHAVSGAVMADFAGQVSKIVSAISVVPGGSAGMVSVLLGANDVCADTLDGMTEPALFEAQFRAGLDILKNSAATRGAAIRVSSIPAIYWLWEAKRTDFLCRVFVWPLVPCGNLLDNPTDDCASTESRLNPDVIYSGDGPNCVRRKEFHARIRGVYNPGAVLDTTSSTDAIRAALGSTALPWHSQGIRRSPSSASSTHRGQPPRRAPR
jgi:cysteine-rich repeat protein